eukprot:CAMPEP_0178458294 /NCGR_PEP_ID=MMETSP0689_2-20121128/47473_1 /TAXON_ID=160604 /ORGANISM="Amphidinium massartii, Strain CS-259" /LENGTH=139 /DNA_ID=CAMNT_0020084601 /DNA_START=169 /DNA_END=587 /DNA_ORIENTATION=+
MSEAPSDVLTKMLKKAREDGKKKEVWTEIFNTLEEWGDDPQLVNRRTLDHGHALLHLAAMHGNRTACLSLVDRFGANPLQTARDGHLPSDIAAAVSAHGFSTSPDFNGMGPPIELDLNCRSVWRSTCSESWFEPSDNIS